MSPVDKAIVERKLDSIRTNVADIETILSKGIHSYGVNHFDRKVMERSLQLVIEAAMDINLHLLRKRAKKVPEDGAKSFSMMGQERLLSMNLAQQLAPCVGLRNRIVHEYDILDAQKVFQGAENVHDLFPTYVSEILSLIE